MEKDLDQLKEDMSKLAEQIADGYGIKLDYTNESIRQVEKILGFVHKDYKKTGSEDGMRGVAFEFAAYIVRTIEKNVGPVRWERDHPKIGENSFPLYLADEDVIFPFGWCEKRIFDGPGDDIWTKYNVFILKQDPPEEKKGFFRNLFGR